MKIELSIKTDSLKELKEILDFKKKVQEKELEPKEEISLVEEEKPVTRQQPSEGIEITDYENNVKPTVKYQNQKKTYSQADAKLMFSEFSKHNFKLNKKVIKDLAISLCRTESSIIAMIRDFNIGRISNNFIMAEYNKFGKPFIDFSLYKTQKVKKKNKTQAKVPDFNNITSITKEVYIKLSEAVYSWLDKYGKISVVDILKFSQENNMNVSNTNSWAYSIRSNYIIENGKPVRNKNNGTPNPSNKLSTVQLNELKSLTVDSLVRNGVVSNSLLREFTKKHNLVKTTVDYYAYQKFRKEWIKQNDKPVSQGNSYMIQNQAKVPEEQPNYVPIQSVKEETYEEPKEMTLIQRVLYSIKKTILNPLDNKGNLVIDKMLIESVGNVELSDEDYRVFLSRFLIAISKEKISGLKRVSTLDNKVYIYF